MNKIFKVIYSKVRNCYVVTSEFAKANTKSSTGSTRGTMKKSLLSLAIASALFCGGLVNVGASVQSEKILTGGIPSNPVLTVDDSDDAAQLNKVISAAKDDKLVTKDNISGQLTDYAKTSDVTNTLSDYAKTTDMNTALADKANADDVYSKTDADNKFADKTTTENALATKANQSNLEAATGRITTAEGEITALKTQTGKLSPDGKSLTDMDAVSGKTVSGDTVNAGSLTVIGLITDGVNTTTLSDIKNSMAQTETNKKDIATLKTTTGEQAAAINELKDKTTNISYDSGKQSTSINGIEIGSHQVDMGEKNLTDVGTINGIDLGKKEGGTYISQDGSIWGNMKKVDTQVKTNADAIGDNTTAITRLDAKVGIVGTGTYYLDPTKSVGDNLGRLDAGLKQEVEDRKAAIGELAVDGKYIKKGMNVSDNLVELDKQAKTNADNIQTNANNIQTNANNIKKNKDEIARVNGELVKTNKYFNKELGKTNDYFNKELGKTNAALQATNKRTAGIERTDTGVAADKQTVIEGKVRFDQNGNVSGVKDLKTDTIHATGEITSEGLDAKAGDIKTTGKVSAGDISTGTLETTGNATIGGDLTVNGKLNVDKIYMEYHKQESTGEEYDSATSITADGISNNAKVTDRNGVTTESKFTHDKEGSTTYAHKGDDTDWKESTSNVTADGVENVAKDSKDNNNTFTQTSTDTKNILKDEDGNTSTTRQDSKGIYGYAKDKDGNKSYTKQEGNRIAESVIGQDGKETKSEMTSTDITNTAKDGTITNDAKDIVNKATGDMTNTIGGKLTTTVTGATKEEYKGGLTTDVTGEENHTVTGNQNNKVTGKQTNTVEGGQENNISGGQTNTITGGQINNITGDQITNVSGTQITTATDINRNASSGMIDTVDNAYGTNKETKVAGKTTTEVSIKGTEEKAEYIRGANEAKDELSKGTLKNSETKTVGATSTEITDGINTSATIQDKTQISGSVTNETSSAVSNVKADSIDTAVKEGANTSLISQKKNSITSAVGNGTTSTVIQQGDKDITIASNGGTVGIAGKDIINNATNEITNTAGAKITDQVGTNTRVLDKEGITDTVGNTSFKQRIDDIMMEAKNGTIASDAKNITNKATEKISNEAAEIANKASGTISNDAAEIKNTAGKLISNKVGENTYQNIENGKITESIKDSAKQNLTQSDAEKTEHSVVNGTNSTVNKQTSEEITNAVTNGTTTNVTQNTATASNNTIADTNGNANTVVSTVNGTQFTNTGANTAIGEGTKTNTTIKGNTITTGKVEMDYADVMKDLGVRGKTTTGSLEVTGTSTLKGDVTMESSATVKKDLTVEGTTTTKDLHVINNATVDGTLDVAKKATFKDSVDIAKNLTVGGNATITGDVTANSYKVGNNTYIDANGINANNQKITNVADGAIAAGSTDAVNGGQLFETNRRIDQFDSRINEVGANAAAMANLHPMEFDADSKLNVAVGVGNYRNKTATAMGLFYRPNEDVMFNVSSTIGSNDNMVGGGISFRLGSGGNKEKTKALAQAAEQNKQLKSQVDTLQAQMDALLSVINPNMSKDFPDVPNNHWAYEAVSRLAGNDIIQGYEDGKYHGERTMTRYEMAVIIYKALQKGAKAEAKLVEEFKPELKAIAAHEKA